MNKTITAINEEKILKKINKNKITENKNILYKEAVLEILKKNKNIDKIIISEKIQGEINFLRFIKKIKQINKKIKIIVILYDKKKEEELKKMQVTEIYYNNIFSVNKLIKQEKKDKNTKIEKHKIIEIINKIKKDEIKTTLEKNIICIYGNNKIDKKIIELILIKKMINKTNIVIINLKINKKTKKEKIKKIKKIENNKYKLYFKTNYKIREKIINKKVKELVNINNILKDKNSLIKIKIIKDIINRYKKNSYLILNINDSNKKINIKNKYKNILVLENNNKNLIKTNRYITNKNTEIIIINYKKNNLSKYFYKIIFKNNSKKIKILNLI